MESSAVFLMEKLPLVLGWLKIGGAILPVFGQSLSILRVCGAVF
jgi:hypothetical protein